MSDTAKKTPRSAIWKRRDRVGLSRERVAALLNPPVTSKTIERWEKGVSPLPGHRRVELQRLYDEYEGRRAA